MCLCNFRTCESLKVRNWSSVFLGVFKVKCGATFSQILKFQWLLSKDTWQPWLDSKPGCDNVLWVCGLKWHAHACKWWFNSSVEVEGKWWGEGVFWAPCCCVRSSSCARHFERILPELRWEWSRAGCSLSYDGSTTTWGWVLSQRGSREATGRAGRDKSGKVKIACKAYSKMPLPARQWFAANRFCLSSQVWFLLIALAWVLTHCAVVLEFWLVMFWTNWVNIWEQLKYTPSIRPLLTQYIHTEI